MLSVYKFREETIDILFYIYFIISLFYLLGAFLGVFKLDPIVLSGMIVFTVIDGIFLVLYKKNKISYFVFSIIFLLSMYLLIVIVYFFNTDIIYRTLWFVTFVPLAYLYGDIKFGVLTTFFSFIIFLFSWQSDFLNVKHQDYAALCISLIVVGITSGMFLYKIEKYEKIFLEEKDKLSKQAVTDYLTGVYNRRGFFEKIENQHGVIGIFDLDYFKNINDTFGHEFGDEYLRFFVDLLKKSVRKDDIIGRLGGDEFVVFFKNAELENLKQWIVNFYKKLDENYYKNIKISVSTGFASYIGDIKESLKQADTALYNSKLKRNMYTICEG
jgi:diguanylate cyclase (GGDEF)-like protein